MRIPLTLLCSSLLCTMTQASPPEIFPPESELSQVISGEDERALLAAGDQLYASPLSQQPGREYYLLRPGPRLSKGSDERPAPRASIYLGLAQLMQPGVPSVLRIKEAEREIRPGDYLMAVPASDRSNDG